MAKQPIVIDPAICGGRPIVAGTRMRVSDVLDALAAGAGTDELLADFPDLTREDIGMPRLWRPGGRPFGGASGLMRPSVRVSIESGSV